MTPAALTISMLAVLVIAAVFLVVALLLVMRRPPAGEGPGAETARRRGLVGAVVCGVVGVLLAVPPAGYLLAALFTDAY